MRMYVCAGASAVYVAKLNQTDGAVAWAFIGEALNPSTHPRSRQ
jgi:hypothetical protein